MHIFTVNLSHADPARASAQKLTMVTCYRAYCEPRSANDKITRLRYPMLTVPKPLPIPMLLTRPAGARVALVMAHGAGAGKDHWFMAGMAQALANCAVATARFDFGYIRAGRKMPDRGPVCEAEVRQVCAAVQQGWPDLRLFAGGKSMGARMTSQTHAAEALPGVQGLVFLGFPLHPAKKPSITRAAHLRCITTPMLFLQGERDALAELTLLRPQIAALTHASLIEIAAADHGFEVPKRTGRDRQALMAELAAHIVTFMTTGDESAVAGS